MYTERKLSEAKRKPAVGGAQTARMTYFKLHDGAGVVRFDDKQRRKMSAQLRHERLGRRGGDPLGIFADIERCALEARAKKAAQATHKG